MTVYGLLFLIFLCGVAGSYPPYILSPVRSAVSSSGVVVFQCDFTGESEPGMVNGGKLFIKGSDNVVREIPMSRVSMFGDYQYTYEATTNISLSGETEAYFMFYDDTTIATQSFRNAGSSFPPSAYCWARAAYDPIGDLENDITDAKLDITGLWTTYSATRLYFKISHAGGDWNVGGLWPPYFSWACFVINPDAPSDTIYYALLYCKNVPGIIGVGLWRFTRSGDYTQIGNIQSQVVNDSLILSCSLDTLSRDPYFGPWPNSSGYLVVGVRTDKAVSLTSTLRADITPSQKFYPSTMVINPAVSNSPPYIFDPTVSESKLTYTYTITINYRDQDNNLPVLRKVLANGIEFDMTSADHSYFDNALFRAVVNLDIPLMTLGFRFFDGRDSSNSVYLFAQENLAKPTGFSLVRAYPNPFNDMLTFEIITEIDSPLRLSFYDVYGALRDVVVLKGIKKGKNIFRYRPSSSMSSGIYYYKIDGLNKGGAVLYLQ